ncbi:MAG: undecaprenyldiphospho-muramoylpentapeptide beta-N-acetylglucosaminyltransferase [Alphaproteobacteria bacterium]|jgi:UDP-N-acetylglucosamine--N-acetylmuramyl-(pentapeptide) pyrophosphoryl-undecaprenol N-acetylglucosamine transferase|nr:undecaprenyldiphospho-muramoylpentapeptide beta-N-acetylglucosaminyltransferase [Alphaproteobacteria bacterium]MBT4966945.1 undecaprenyldiphospho-muramoylpentapeptide beta-N-acetylglucosaminyltransferase [Alphaproteobacteria bacterium]MBT5160851.1 undecaprenyldiphospho-muramoylpentapeptide beta-N-acetylglucosaminyltransferase [Alphaproteobacteria bacterium]MBT5919626.1 undecaprenyldiphospho-muramoylpentapeptide beta-N-acetylglucosaminyltransferase [Alphaproteobacteria bacterium]MBT6386190.1 
MTSINQTGPVILAAGGTGGHLFPAEALAGELMARGRDVMLVTDTRGDTHTASVDSPLARIERFVVRAGTVSGQSAFGKIKGLIELVAGFWQARALLARLQPSVVVGFGGYPSLPTMLAATRRGTPAILHEQNAVLGRVNRVLAPRVNAIAVAFTDTAKLEPGDFAKVKVVGNPVRAAVRAVRGKPYPVPEVGGAFNILVLGGSQGATVLSDVVPVALSQLPDELKHRLHITQQCRPEDLDRVRQIYAEAGLQTDLATFFDDVPARLAETHLIVSRAGASTVSEAAVAGRPALLVPYPHATDDHQTGNAKAFVEPGAGWMAPQQSFTKQFVADTITDLMAHPEKLTDAAASALNVGRADSAPRLADLVESLIREGNGANGGSSSPQEEAA